jgi:hypothetical protein
MPTTYAIPNGRTAMDATLVSGVTGGVQTVNNSDLGTVGFKPDLIWTKTRNAADNNYLVDSVRGTSNYIISNSNVAEASNANFITGITSTGYSYGSAGYGSGTTLVGWQWVAGQGVNNTNNAGTITSTVSANTTTGFSIVTYTGNGSNGASVGHGLSVTPSMIIFKDRTGTNGWLVYHSSIPSPTGNYLVLNATAATSAASGWCTPDASKITFTTSYSGTNANGSNFVAYCWTPIAGFSQFGSYTGNGSSDGPFIYTGFRPKFFMYKSTSYSPTDWNIVDTSRDTYNASQKYLRPNTSGAEGNDGDLLDLLSNGIKIRRSFSDLNRSGENYIYMAFAENPFKFANAR